MVLAGPFVNAITALQSSRAPAAATRSSSLRIRTRASRIWAWVASSRMTAECH